MLNKLKLLTSNYHNFYNKLGDSGSREITKAFTAILPLCLLTPSIAEADWKYTDDSIKYYIHDGSRLASRANAHQFKQPNGYTCGAATTASMISWETYRASGGTQSIHYDVNSVYNYINDSGEGITANELKDGWDKLFKYTVRDPNGPLSGYSENFTLKEVGSNTIEQGIRRAIFQLDINSAVSAIYGKTKNSPSPGSHYHLITGYIDCPSDICGSDVLGVWKNDPVYNSSAYNSTTETLMGAKGPNTFISESEMSSYWTKTGAPVYQSWNRKYYLLSYER